MGRNIVILGETGSGKSSIVNILTGTNNAKVSNAATGCTYEVNEYLTPLGDVIFDTVGLNESNLGTVNPQQAIVALATLLYSVNGSVNLLIFVMKKGKITDALKKNYELFVQGICKGKVPVLLIVTNCEMGNNLWDWVDQNEAELRKIGNFDTILPACATPWTAGEFQEKMKDVVNEAYVLTKGLLKAQLSTGKYEEGHTFGPWKNWLKSSFRVLFNKLAETFGWNQMCLSDDLKRTIQEALSCDEKYAATLANRVVQQRKISGNKRVTSHTQGCSEPTETSSNDKDANSAQGVERTTGKPRTDEPDPSKSQARCYNVPDVTKTTAERRTIQKYKSVESKGQGSEQGKRKTWANTQQEDLQKGDGSTTFVELGTVSKSRTPSMSSNKHGGISTELGHVSKDKLPKPGDHLAKGTRPASPHHTLNRSKSRYSSIPPDYSSSEEEIKPEINEPEIPSEQTTTKNSQPPRNQKRRDKLSLLEVKGGSKTQVTSVPVEVSKLNLEENPSSASSTLDSPKQRKQPLSESKPKPAVHPKPEGKPNKKQPQPCSFPAKARAKSESPPPFIPDSPGRKADSGGISKMAGTSTLTEAQIEGLGPVIVLDNGSSTCKAGFAGEDVPRSVVPTVVSKPRYPGTTLETFYVGVQAQLKRALLTHTCPMQNGAINSWDDMEKIWSHMFHDELSVTPSNHPLLLTEAPYTSNKSRENTAEIMFEKFEIPALQTSIQGVLSLYSANKVTGIAIDIGDGVTQVVPMYEGTVFHHAIIQTDQGGLRLTDYLQQMLNINAGGHKFTTRADMAVVRDIKHTLCYVPQDFGKESSEDKGYELPDGQMVSVGNERFRCPEGLFQPLVVGLLEGSSLQAMVHESINKCDRDTREALYGNIVLSGGSSLFPGIEDRLQKELTALAPGGTKIHISAPESRKHAVWLGGSVLGSLPNGFQDGCVTKQQYDEVGPTIVHRNI